MNSIFWISVASMGGLGILFGAGLAFASKKFSVETDPRIGKIRDVLPGVNCGACGYPGCDGFAAAVAEGSVAPNSCPVMEKDACVIIAGIMGLEECQHEKLVARILCGGDCHKSKEKYVYHGINDCVSAHKLAGGSKSCSYGCLGLSNCIRVCPFDAIDIMNGIAVVDYNKCTGCGKCVNECPKSLIEIIPAASQVVVSCISKDKGKQVKGYCEVGCIGCRICVKACEYDAINFEDNLAKIDYQKCTNCMLCAEKCPTNTIQADFKHGTTDFIQEENCIS